MPPTDPSLAPSLHSLPVCHSQPYSDTGPEPRGRRRGGLLSLLPSREKARLRGRPPRPLMHPLHTAAVGAPRLAFHAPFGDIVTMPPPAARLTAAVQQYLSDLRTIRASGGATGERSYYPPLSNLLNAVGAALRPKVTCVTELADHGAGHPDLGLYTAQQLRRGKSPKGQKPERGVIEVKPAGDDAWLTAGSDQVSKYWGTYRLVLVTNTRDFVLLGEDSQGRPAKLETFRLADSAQDFEARLETPRAFAGDVGRALGEYLCRALSHTAALVEPRDLAWLLASYARDGLARVEKAGDEPSLHAVRSALEEALGVRFEGDRGAAFFRSTLVQTLFYGVFSAWVLWARQAPPPTGYFDWRTAVWHLRAPVLRALFQQLSNPGQLRSLGLVEVLDWTAAALDRVDRAAFFDRFSEGEAVPYFYEPFLEAFDPDLRKQLGVWYTPVEVVRYMVARVDRALKDDLGIPEGLAADNVYVLDPCCGTGAYLAEVLRRIAANLESRGLGALTGARVKQAATERVFGFEIMPAPFVVAHLQVGLTMQSLDATLSDDGNERAGVFLTNALTGWEPSERKTIPFPELEEERERAERVKQEAPVLVILGNPPYNGFAGMAIDEERELSEAYRTVREVRRPEGQGLNDLYVRFFRMAERRIAERRKKGIICFISNYSWLDGLSFTGMRERYLEAFDTIRIDNLHGDRIISEYAPDGRTSETVFALHGQSPGIRVGTAITLLSKSGGVPAPDRRIHYRDFHQARANERRQALLDSLDTPEINSGYLPIESDLQLGLPFKPTAASDTWHDWPALPDLFPIAFSGVKTARDGFLVDIDLGPLKARIADYFDPALDHEEVERRHPIAMKTAPRFNPRSVRAALLSRGGPVESGFVRYTFRPFDTRWLYWESDTKLLDEKRAEYKPHVFEGNLWLSSSHRIRKGETEPQTAFTRHIASYHLIERVANWFPAYLRDDALQIDMPEGAPRRPNLSPAAESYLERLGANVEDLFHHVIAVLHDPAYREANAGALRMEWPRIPLPGWPDGDQDGAADELAASAARGRQLAALLDSDTPVPGVTDPLPGAPAGSALRPEIAAVAVPSTTDGGNMTGEDFALTEGWGHFGQNEAVMPGQGRVVERPYTASERAALDKAARTTGDTTSDPTNRAGTGNPPTPPVPASHADTATGNTAAILGDTTSDPTNRAGTGSPPTPPVPASHADTATGKTAAILGDTIFDPTNRAGTGSPPTPPVPASHVDTATGNTAAILGETTFDIYLNDRAYWRNVPAAVWSYKLGGYQVLKKWLSYREHTILDRPLKPDEVHHFTNTARRITAILLLTGADQ